MRNLSRRTLLLGLGSALAMHATSLQAAEAPLTAFAPTGTVALGHRRFDALLQRYVKPDGASYNRVDYRSFQQSGRSELAAYLDGLSAQDPTRLSGDEAHAYWINLYNAKTLDVVLKHYPVSSIRKIDLGGGGLFRGGPWSKKIVRVAGTDLSLDDIEHRIVRPLFSEPLSHYGLNCASYSCPNLATRAYTGENLREVLAQSAHDYVNHPRGITVSAETITASKVYSWYAEDFGGTARLKTHWTAFAAPDLQARIADAEIRGYAYDWSLNDL
nr:DUF547 domain-containing protein [Mesorhizobium sp.]